MDSETPSGTQEQAPEAVPADQAAAGGHVLGVSDISKSYGQNLVLRGVSFGVPRGSIYGLMGANGAGKSTLIKVLSGAEQADAGSVTIGGEPVMLTDPQAASRAGIATVHQDPNDGLILDMTVAENLALDSLAGKGRLMFSHRAAERLATEVADHLGLALPTSVLRAPARDLGISERQLLVLARALSKKPEILILDEPTSALSADETERLFTLIREQVDGGMTVMYVSHKLAEFDALCHHVGVLRDGRLRGEFDKQPLAGGRGEGFDWPVVLQALFDRSPSQMQREEAIGDDGAAVLAMSGVAVLPGAEPFDLDLRRGEVTVLLGLLGSGKSELLEWLFGARRALSGSVTLNGKAYAPRSPARAQAAGVYLVPESRSEQAIVAGWPVYQQMTLPFLNTYAYTPASLMSGGRERKAAAGMIERLGIVTEGPGSAIGTLSGGNQQKVVIGRWLLGDPDVLLLDEPFRGVDINARHDIGDTIRGLTDQAAVLVATSDIDEALEVADRIVVMRQGSVVEDLRYSTATRDNLIEAMSSRSSSLLAEDEETA